MKPSLFALMAATAAVAQENLGGTLFSDADFGGDSQTIEEGKCTQLKSGLGTKLGSIRVEPNLVCAFYSQSDCKKEITQFDASNGTLTGDIPKSVNCFINGF